VLSLVQVLRHLGVTFGVLRKEKCTSDPVRRLGSDPLFQQMAEANIEQLKPVKAAKLLSICPHCVRTIGEHWKEFGAAFQIERHSELLARMREKLPQRAAERESVVFHDPCYLGRYRGVYDEPREVIARWGEVAEPARARERSFCCGAGGGQMFLGEEKGKRVNVERATELAATGAAVVGTALSVLPDHVPRRARDDRSNAEPDAAQAAGHRANCGGLHRARGGARNGIILNWRAARLSCGRAQPSRQNTASGRVAQLAEQVTLNH
jgi:cysteine-rich protein